MTYLTKAIKENFISCQVFAPISVGFSIQNNLEQ